MLLKIRYSKKCKIQKVYLTGTVVFDAVPAPARKIMCPRFRLGKTGFLLHQFRHIPISLVLNTGTRIKASGSSTVLPVVCILMQ
jgi:hypothetical protein